MSKLLPCPFCGCDGIKVFYDHPDAVGPTYAGHYVSHPLWREYPTTWGCRVQFGGTFDTEAEAITAWNTRIQTGDSA